MYTEQEIRLIEWQNIEPEPLGGDLAEDLCKVINKFIKFGLTQWWSSKGFQKESKQEYLSMKGSFDKVVRQAVYMAKTIACAIKFNIYDENETGIKEYVARDRYIKLLRSCINCHKANVEGGWGCQRETVACCSELLFACWIVWEKLNAKDKKNVLNVLFEEVENAMRVEIEYNYSLDGLSKGAGECKSIYDMDYANLLYLASIMACKNAEAENHRQKAIKTYRACFSSRTDSDITGFNVENDMILRQYDAKSPLATSQIGVGIKAYLLSKLTEEFIPSGVSRNFEKIYQAFYHYEVLEKGIKKGVFTIYDKKNRPQGGCVYPDGVKGGKVNESALYNMDIFAFLLGKEDCIDIPSREWAKVRIKKIDKNFSKNPKYAISGASQFKYIHGEAVCSQLIDAYMALFLYVLTKKYETANVEKTTEQVDEEDAFAIP